MNRTKKIGLAIIIVGVMILLTALPVVPMSTVELTLGDASVKATDISEASVIRITVGFIISIIGLAVYSEKILKFK